MREKHIENLIKKYLKNKGAYVIKYHGGTYSTSGTPDLIVCYKGYFIALEIKNEIGKTTKLQEMHLQGIKKAGGISQVVRSVEEVKKIIETL